MTGMGWRPPERVAYCLQPAERYGRSASCDGQSWWMSQSTIGPRYTGRSVDQPARIARSVLERVDDARARHHDDDRQQAVRDPDRAGLLVGADDVVEPA